ncbi:Bug family tripartite tricarboxylate transporter substrate binding protein [Delftia sp. PS-11]|uniref:Bug family tripartite tricarboxylate transporter substrate binding protein n=1 Tax=Delftia sp. PS-11 TaxID=2767222 RepID=UPI002454B0F4|nr:tripartite tricarboxylate transporter substrate binding protein [Delftia sp. PS-11]KAJ8746779.1 tripartite tricarboxylate transporter substrate binding protein [Delftia sp. PS-11]
MTPISTPLTRRRGLQALAAASLAALGALTGTAALAQEQFPSKPITIIVPFAAGGTTDILARIVSQALQQELGQTVIVDNKPGAGGNIGAVAAARAPADGYTLFMGTVGTHAINAALYSKPGYDPIKDFSPLTRVANVPNLLVAHPSQPFKTVKEMIAYARANPGKLNYGSSGSGSSIHLSGELFRSMTGLDMVHVPYKGSAPAITDLLGNQIAIMFDNMPSAIQHVRSGKLRPIAVTTAKRSPELPDVPTVAESGVPGYEATSWFGLWTQAKTPAPVQQRLYTAIAKVLKDPAVVKKINDQGGDVTIDTQAEFLSYIKSESAKWSKVVKDSGAQV